MKISCPACAAKYSIADEKVQDRLAKIRCRKCGTTIVIDGKVNPASVYAADGGSDPVQPSAPMASQTSTEAEYSVDFGDNDQRTMSVAALVEAYNAGEVTTETYVWAEGMADWAPLGDMPDIVDALHAAATSSPQASTSSDPAGSPAPHSEPPASAPVTSAPLTSAAAPTESAPQPEATPDFSAAAGLSARAASPWENEAHRAAARPGGGRGSTADLFGNFDTAGSEEDVTTSAPQGAGPAQQTTATGARNESSVLFSLSALTSAAAATPAASSASSPSPSNAAAHEDSGLIDLKALTSSPSTTDTSPAPAGLAAPLMAPPLGIAAPLGSGVEAQVSIPPLGQKNRTGLYIGGGIAIAAIAIAATIAVTSSKPPPAPQPTAAAASPAAPGATQSAPTPEPKLTAQPPATGTAEEAASAKPSGKTATHHHYVWHGHASKSSSKSSTASAVKASAPKKVVHHHSACGCAPGDLECAMRCAAR